MNYVILTYDTDSSNRPELDCVECVGVHNNLKQAQEDLLKQVKTKYPEEEGYELDENEDEVLIWADGEFVAKYWIIPVK